MADKKKKGISLTSLERRLRAVTSIAKALQEGKPIGKKFAFKNKVAYILWQFPAARDSDITLALNYYKVFFPERVPGDIIKFDDLYVLDKMYDLQRARADLQNIHGWCLASPEIQAARKRKEETERAYYSETKADTDTRNYYIYLDESGKTDPQFVVAGVAFRGAASLTRFTQEAEQLALKAVQQFGVQSFEFKFSKIKPNNLDLYKNFVITLLDKCPEMMFYSTILDNSHLNTESKRTRTLECAKLLILDALKIVVLKNFQEPNATTEIRLNVCLDQDGPGYHPLHKAKIEADMRAGITNTYSNLCFLDTLTWEDSKQMLPLQLADLLASSLNNIYSDMPTESENAQAKRDFALWLIEMLGGLSLVQNNTTTGVCVYGRFIAKKEKSPYPDDVTQLETTSKKDAATVKQPVTV